jgi:hypothetical protein
MSLSISAEPVAAIKKPLETTLGSILLELKVNNERELPAFKTKALNLSLLVTKAAIEALKNLQECNLSAFDPLVGDTACQIRAAKILEIALSLDPTTKLKLKSIIEQCGKVQDRILELLQGKDAKEKRKKEKNAEKKITIEKIPCTLASFRKENDLEIENIPEDLLFAIESLILSKIKALVLEEGQRVETIDPNLLNKNFEVQIAKEPLRNLVLQLQKSLSERSIHFVQQQAELFSQEKNPLQQEDSLKQCVSDQKILNDHIGRCALPCFFETEILLRGLAEKKRLVTLIIRKPKETTSEEKGSSQLNLLFQGRGVEKTEFQRLDLNEEKNKSDLENSPAFVMEGESSSMVDRDILDQFDKEGLFSIVLANAAQHPQFPKNFEKGIGEKFQNTQRIEDNRKISEQIGCSENNKKCFFIHHVFCDRVIHAFSSITPRHFSNTNLL